jgi:uncharacterized protein (DUF4415 family)
MPRAKITRVELAADGRVYKIEPGGGRRLMKDRTDWKRVAAMTEEEIVANALSDPDNPPLTEAQLKNMRPFKRPITIRVDVDVLNWFRTRGVKYQTHMNAALRDYMNANARKKRPRART